MSPEYTVEAADGFYIARNGEGVLDLADPQDYEFAEFVCAALNQAAEPTLLTEPVNYCNPVNGVHAPFCTGHETANP